MYMIDVVLKASVGVAVLLILAAAAVDVYKEENRNIEKMFEDIKEEEKDD